MPKTNLLKTIQIHIVVSVSLQACRNLFKSSAREGSRGVIHNKILEKLGISVINSTSASQVVCNTCARKVRLLDTTYESLNKNIGAESECNNNSNRKTAYAIHTDRTKRKSLEAISPVTRSPCMRKVRRFQSPASKKYLNFDEAADE